MIHIDVVERIALMKARGEITEAEAVELIDAADDGLDRNGKPTTGHDDWLLG